MQECKSCKKQYADGTKFCSQCGAELSVSNDTDNYANFYVRQPNYSGYPVYQAENRPIEASPIKKHARFFNLVYSAIIFFMLFPMLFPEYLFRGFGQFGYGVRHQIAAFAEISDPEMSTALLLLINSIIILLIISVILIVCFCIVSMVFINKANAKKQFYSAKILKIFNLIIFASFLFIFFASFKYLTFTFVCGHLLAFFALLLNLKPQFIVDLTTRKQNEEKNSAAVSMLIFASLLAFCFSPIYRVLLDTNLTIRDNRSYVSYNFFDFIMSAFNGKEIKVDNFLAVISMILLAVMLFFFIFSVIRYLFIEKRMWMGHINTAALVASVICIVLIGAFIRVEIQRQRMSNPPELSWVYYIFLAFIIISLIIPFIQRAADFVAAKKSDGQK